MKSEAITVFGQLAGMLGLGLLAVVIVLGLLLGGCLVTDSIISRHSFSTSDAPGFSEEKFSKISKGMTGAQVQSILGAPLRTGRRAEGGQEWWFTAPKEPIEGWGTWDGRYLIISNDRVTEVYSHTVLNH